MSDRLLVGTKKGLFDLRRTRGHMVDRRHAASSATRSPCCCTIRATARCMPREALGHFGVKLQRSRDGGETLAGDPGTGVPQDRRPDGPSVSYLFCLETGGADQPGWLWCGTIPGALFLSTDHGKSWSLNEPLWDLPERKEWMGGGFDDAGVALDLRRSAPLGPPDRRRLHRRRLGQRRRRRIPGAASSDGMHADYFPPERRQRPGGAGRASAGAVPRGAGHDVGAAP